MMLEQWYTDSGEEELASGEYALAWFSSSKRALLAPFGAGTVDQVELGGLNTRYYMLRLFGLAGKTVIIDEVHAYDTYMNTILDHTLTWLAALGSTVILLSATLPSQRHAELATAFQNGFGGPVVHQSSSTAIAYPVIACYHVTGQETIPIAAFRPQQQLVIRWLHDQTPEQQAQRLIDLVAQGGAVARICNRVADAQDIYVALEQLSGFDELVLIHAQMPLSKRTEREKIVDQLVGVNSQRTPQQRIAQLMRDQALIRLTPKTTALRDPITAGGHDIFIADEDGGMQGWIAAKTPLGDRITTIPLYCHADGRLSLDPAGERLLPDKRKDSLSLKQQQDLLGQSLPISSPDRLLKQVRKEQWRWRTVPPLLKYVYPLYLHPNGIAIINPRVRLDPMLGLIVYSEEQ